MADYGARYSDKKLREIDKGFRSTYRTAQAELKKKLADFNKRFAQKDKQMREKLEKGEISKQQYKDWLTGQVFQREQWKANIREVNHVLLNSNRQAAEIINNGRLDVFAENYNYMAFKGEGSTGISFGIYSTQAVARLIADDPQILPEWKIDEEKDYEWNQKKVNNIVQQGIIQGESIPEITDRLSHDLSTLNENRMRLFARTAITGAQNAGRQQQMNDAADMGIDVHKQWLATLDSRTRDVHRQLDGQEVNYNEPFESALGEIEYPGDPDADPANVYNCRCTMVSIYPKYEDRSKPGWRGEETIDGQSYEEWKEGKEGAKKAAERSSMKKDEEESRKGEYSMLDRFTYNEEKGILYGEPIVKGIGARSQSYPVLANPVTGQRIEFVAGTRPEYPHDHTIAGRGSRKKIRDIERLTATYHVSAEGWQKEKARYRVYDEYGEERIIELHWYQHPDIGRVEYKVKTRNGRIYVDEW